MFNDARMQINIENLHLSLAFLPIYMVILLSFLVKYNISEIPKFLVFLNFKSFKAMARCASPMGAKKLGYHNL